MRGLRPRLTVDEANWTAVLARKLRSECLENEANPFTPERGNEAEDYCNASAASRLGCGSGLNLTGAASGC